MLTTRLLTKYLAWRTKALKAKVVETKVDAVSTEGLLKAKPKLDEKLAQEEDYFEPLSFEQAQLVLQGLRKTTTLLSPWRLIRWQLVVVVFATFVACLGFGGWPIPLSVVYGGMAVVLPASVFAWGLKRSEGVKSPLLASAGFFIWEAAKVGLTVALLCVAPILIVNINWLALLAGFVVTMKVYWIALWLYPMRKNFFNN